MSWIGAIWAYFTVVATIAYLCGINWCCCDKILIVSGWWGSALITWPSYNMIVVCSLRACISGSRVRLLGTVVTFRTCEFCQVECWIVGVFCARLGRTEVAGWTLVASSLQRIWLIVAGCASYWEWTSSGTALTNSASFIFGCLLRAACRTVVALQTSSSCNWRWNISSHSSCEWTCSLN